MSHENNTILAEQLADLEEEAKDTEKYYLNDKKALAQDIKNLTKSELAYYKAKLELAEFKIKLQSHD